MISLLQALLVFIVLFFIVPIWIYIIFKVAGKGWTRGRMEQLNDLFEGGKLHGPKIQEK